MGSELRISNATFTNYRASVVPSIAGLITWAFFGSTGSGNNGNLVPGGPTLQLYASSALSSNYRTLGTAGAFATFTPPTIGALGALNNDGAVLTGGSGYHGIASQIAWPGTGLSSQGFDNIVVSGGVVTGVTAPHIAGLGYVTVSGPASTGGNAGFLDTNVTRNYTVGGNSLLTTGWTMACVARVPSSGVPSALMGDRYVPGNTGFAWSVTMQQATQRLFGGMFSQRAINLPTAATNWRFVAHTFSGTTSGTPNIDTLYSVSDGLSSVVGPTGGALQNGEQFYFGPGPNTSNNGVMDIAFGMLTQGALSSGTLTTIYTSVKSILALRGIAVV